MKKLIFISLLLTINSAFAQQKPIEISGVYPAFAAFNSSPNSPKPQAECGIGALVPWAGKLWYLSYTSHDLFEGKDKLHSIDENYQHEVRPESVGGTHACRMIHKESDQLIIGCYFIFQTQEAYNDVRRTALITLKDPDGTAKRFPYPVNEISRNANAPQASDINTVYQDNARLFWGKL